MHCWRCQWGPEGIHRGNDIARTTRFDIETGGFLVKNASCRFGELRFLLRQGAHFCKHRENMAGKWNLHPNNFKWRLWCLYVRAWWGWKAKMLRFHRLRSVPSGPINSKPTLLRHILPVQRRPWYDEKGNRRDKGAIRAKHGLQKRFYPTLFDVEKVNLLVQNASYRF